MKPYITPPMLSTSFSQNAESAKRRFANILNPKKYKHGAVSFLLIALCIILPAACIAFIASENISSSSAVITENSFIYADENGEYIMYPIEKNDIVFVIYDQNDKFYYVQKAVMDLPAVEGYVLKNKLSFNQKDIINANNGVLNSAAVYLSPNENDIYKQNCSGTVAIINRGKKWSQIELIGGDSGKWVKTDDIEYSLIPAAVNLKYAALQKEVDNGHYPWRLTPENVALEYFRNNLKLSDGKITECEDYLYGKTYTYTEKNGGIFRVSVTQPVKHDNSGIWTTDKSYSDSADTAAQLINIICSSPAASSVPADYTNAHSKEFSKLINMGQPALDYMFAQFENGKQTGLKGHIMHLACKEILDGEYIEFDADTGQEWYNKYKNYMLSIAE